MFCILFFHSVYAEKYVNCFTFHTHCTLTRTYHLIIIYLFIKGRAPGMHTLAVCAYRSILAAWRVSAWMNSLAPTVNVVRIFYKWYEESIVRIVQGTNSPHTQSGTYRRISSVNI